MRDYNFTSFGRYVLADSLAKGGMGQVYLSIYGESGWEKFCAIKRILPQSSSSEALLRFKTEAEITSRLNHSNLVSLFDVGIINQNAYMAMELVEGQNLREIWNRCAKKRIPFPMEIIIFMIKESAKGLAYAHKFKNLNLVHRDISPPNLMLTYQGEMKVLDFGLALSENSKRFTKPGVIYGKMPYLSPEQARGEDLTGKSDIYSLGIVFWELITGRRLFEQKEEENLVEKLKQRGEGPTIKAPSDVSGRGDEELDRIVLSMLDPSIANRPSGDELVSILGKYLSSKYPGTETTSSEKFICDLFDEEISSVERERTVLLEKYRSWKNNKDKRSVRAGDLIANRYLVTRLIGEGGMGKVYEALHESIGKRVAIKVLEPKSNMAKEEAEIRFKREAKAASRISHPSVVNVLDYGFISSNQPFLVMELLEGRNLGDSIREGALRTKKGCEFGAQLARGIHAAHEAGLIHRDIKPDNIHIITDHSGKELIKLIDFGIAKSSLGADEDLTKPGIALGTPEYIAPELLLGVKPSALSDIYSYGAVLYEIFTGKPPYSGIRTEVIIQDKIKGRMKSINDERPDLPIKIRRIIESCMNPEPNKRPSSLRNIAVQFEEIVENFSNPSRMVGNFVPSTAISCVPRRNNKLKSYKNSESGSWMPLALAISGVVVFILGLMQVGKQRPVFKDFNDVKMSSGNYSFMKIASNSFPLVKEKNITKENEELDPKSIIVKVKSGKLHVRHGNVRNKVKNKVKSRIVRKSTKKQKINKSRGRKYLRLAKSAYANGEYTKAYEMARRSVRYGGGKDARRIHSKIEHILGI